MDARVAQMAAGLVATATPWIVVRIALAVATRHAPAPVPTALAARTRVRLRRATVVTAGVVGAFAVVLPPASGWMAIISGVAFTGLSTLGLRALGEIDAATHAVRHLESATRTASLVARMHPTYVPRTWQLLLFALAIAALALLAWRITMPSDVDRRLFLPVAFALPALVYKAKSLAQFLA